MNYYPHHIGDYAKDTAHLSMHEHGAYRLMLDLYYSTELPLPLDRARLYRLTRALSKQDRQCIDTVLPEFFTEQSDGWHHKRCDAEIEKAQAKAGKARESAEKRWQSERNANAYANAPPDAMRSHSDGNAPNNQEPIANSQEPREKTKRVATLTRPDWLPPEWDEYEQHRLEKRSKLTATARTGCIRQLEKWRSQGHDIVQIMRHSIDNGYTGLIEPKPNGNGRGPPNRQEALEERNRQIAESWSPPEMRDAAT